MHLQVLVDADNVPPARVRAVLAELPPDADIVVVGSARSLARVDWPAHARVEEASGWQRADVALAEIYEGGDAPLVLISGDGDFALLAQQHRGPVLVVSEAASVRLRRVATVIDPVHDGTERLRAWLAAVGFAEPTIELAPRDSGGARVQQLGPDPSEQVIDDLADVLVDCVAGGASVGFVASLGLREARAWWRSSLQEPETLTWVAAADDGRIVGVVRLIPALKPNARHRAEVVKLLVRRDARGRGVAQRLIAALEEHAAEVGRWLLVLDTETDSPAQRLYEGWGWQPVGVLKDYALTPDGVLAPTTFMSKRLPHS